MLNTLKALFRATTEKPPEQNQRHPVAAGLHLDIPPDVLEGLRLNGRVNIKLIGLRAHPDALFRWDDEAYHHIAAVGHVDLGQGAHLVRFYLDNDTWLQANIENEQVVEYKLFDFYQVAHLSDVEFDTLVNGTDPHTNSLGAQTVTITSTEAAERVCSYQRVWGDAAREWSPPVVFEEQVVTTDSISGRYVTHHAMLFERVIKDAERMEYVLVSAENDGDGGFMVVHNVGVDVASVDIDAL
ncbi:MAG: YjfK family protein [Halomonas sp.]|nr:YjfK family protein [Halomonas sp.]